MYRIVYAIPGAIARTALGPGEVVRRRDVLASWAAPDVEVEVRAVDTGPLSIESAYEEHASVAATGLLVRDAEQEGFDAAILGCFGDPGLDALREITSTMPVVGPGEAAFHVAAMLGDQFGIVTVTDGIVPPLRHLVARSGLRERLAGIAVTDTAVLDVTGHRERVRAAVVEQARSLVERRDADVIVLGCMSMAFLDVTAELEAELGVPVVNPARVSLHTAELLCRTGLGVSARAYRTPAKLTAGSAARLEDLLLH